MRYNGKCTVWHKLSDGTFIRTVYDCWRQEQQSQKISKTAQDISYSAFVLLPITADVQVNDYIVDGEVDFNLTNNIVDLLKQHKALKIMSVAPKNYGSAVMRHTRIEVQ